MDPNRKLDRIDLRILAKLQTSARITNVDLADAVGLSPSPCLIRVKRLEKAGFIRGYGTHIALEMLGNVQLVFTEVTLSDHRREDFQRFEACVRDIPEIVECHMVGGGYDYMVKFVTRGVSHYQEVVESLLDRCIGIEKYFSYLVIKTPVMKYSYPIEGLAVVDP